MDAFGDQVCNIDALIATKTVTLAKLMEIAPSATVDPTPFLYDTTMYSMAGLLAVGLLANSQVCAVDPSLYMAADGRSQLETRQFRSVS